MPLVLAGIAAVEVAIVHNFVWYYFFTWKDRVQRSRGDFFRRLLRYDLVPAP